MNAQCPTCNGDLDIAGHCAGCDYINAQLDKAASVASSPIEKLSAYAITAHRYFNFAGNAPIEKLSACGWLCPRCGKSNAPTVRSCDCAAPVLNVPEAIPPANPA